MKGKQKKKASDQKSWRHGRRRGSEELKQGKYRKMSLNEDVQQAAWVQKGWPGRGGRATCAGGL